MTLGMVRFVDDCNGQTNNFTVNGSSESVLNLVSQAQQNAQSWNDILAASGGALELSKTSCHILQWIFVANGAPVLAPINPEYLASLTVGDDEDSKRTHCLEVFSAYKANKTLGHYKDPAGTQKEQYCQLKKKSDKITALLWKFPLTRLETWTFYHA